MTKKVACIGGGPGGLFFATLLKQYRPSVDVTVFERNGPTQTFGFGVVFSDATLDRIDEADSVLRDALRTQGRHWDTIEMHVKGEVHTFGGNGMSAIHRRTLLRLLQDRARAAGVELRFDSLADVASVAQEFDLVVGSDGAHSTTRAALGDLGHTTERARTKYIWFGTPQRFSGLTNIHRQTPHGNIAVVAYPISDELSTFVAECDEDTWRRAGFDGFDDAGPYGQSDARSQAYLEDLFADVLDGRGLVGNSSRWASFVTRRTAVWHRGSVVLLGDALHTAHFSVGSGTKMAMEDAVVLARELAGSLDDPSAAFVRYAEERRPETDRLQAVAGPSLGWWERFTQYYDGFDPLTFTFHYFTRHLTLEKVRRRDPKLAAAVEAHWVATHGSPVLETPLVVGTTMFPGRLLAFHPDTGCLTTPDRATDAACVPVVVTAPEDESDVDAVVDGLPDSGAVIITGGSRWTRSLVAEAARLDRGLAAFLAAEPGDDRDRAATAVLSGRADAVAVVADSGRTRA